MIILMVILRLLIFFIPVITFAILVETGKKLNRIDSEYE